MKKDNKQEENFTLHHLDVITGTFYVLLKNDFELIISKNIRDISFDKEKCMLVIYNGQYTKEEKGFLFSDRKIEHQQGILISFEFIVKVMNDEGETIWEP